MKKDFEIILVDNGSTDGSVDFVRSHYPQVRLILNQHNLGFAAANNQAIQTSVSEYIATLNNDTRADPGWLAALVEAMKAYPNVGMCASKMLLADRPNMIDSAGIAIDRAGIAWDHLGGSMDDPGETSLQPVFGPCAGAALYRRTMLDQIGLFDEDFFAYLEDVDLAWRGQSAGWQALFVPRARVYHHHSATGKEGSPFKNRLLGRNKVWLIMKNYPTPQLWRYLPLILLYDFAAVSYAALARHDLNPLRGRLAGFRSLPTALRKRREIQRRRRVTQNDAMYHIAPVEAPWRVLMRYRHLRSADRDAG